MCLCLFLCSLSVWTSPNSEVTDSTRKTFLHVRRVSSWYKKSNYIYCYAASWIAEMYSVRSPVQRCVWADFTAQNCPSDCSYWWIFEMKISSKLPCYYLYLQLPLKKPRAASSPKYILYLPKCQLCSLPPKEAAGNISVPLLGGRTSKRGDKRST